MNSYVWKHFPGSEDWGLFPRGTKELEEDTAVVILSRMNSGFPWDVYIGGKKDNSAIEGCETDKLKDIKDYILKNIDNILGKKDECLKESVNDKYYEVELGILLNPDDAEYDSYKMDGVYDGEHSFYDENQYADDSDFEELKEKLLAHVKKGVENTYCIIKGPFDLDGAESVDDVEDFSYDVNDVIFSAYKDKDGNIVEDFLKVSESLDEGKTVQTKKQLDDEIYVEYSFDDKKYYLASDYDRYVWTNFNSIEDAESFYKYHKNDVRNSIIDEKLDSDDELESVKKIYLDGIAKINKEPSSQSWNSFLDFCAAAGFADKEDIKAWRDVFNENLEEGKKPMKYEISYIDSDGHEVNNQIFTAEGVSGHLKNLEEWGCKNIVVKSLEEVEETLTEAPDDDGIMNDDELDAEEQKERDELEARLKARRDKVAQERSERDAKVARENELKAKADEKAKEIGDDWSFDHLFDVLVPSSGKCDSLAGELLRAANRIDYRWFNDGDRFFEDYGIETCGQPAYFLMNFEINDETPLWDFLLKVAEDEADDKYYDSFLDELKNRVAEIIQDNPTLLVSETNDMYDVASVREVANFFYDNNMVPQYDFDCSIPPELDAHLERGNIDERDIVWYVQDIIANMGDSSSDVEVSWGSVYIHDLDRNDYDELNGNLYRWLEDYAQELTDEYGDLDAIEDEPEEEQEEADESLKEDQEEEKEPDDNENHGYATKENYERSQAILDEMSQLRKDEGEQESKFLKAWAVDKVISDDEFTKKMKKLHKEIQDKEDALYKELCELHTKDKELKNQEEK